MDSPARYRIVVPGRPVPAARMTQASKYRGDGRIERHLNQQLAIGWAARAAHVRMMEGPMWMVCHFRIHGKPLPDASNLLKLVEDALNGIAYADDRQLCRLVIIREEIDQADAQWTQVQWGRIPQTS